MSAADRLRRSSIRSFEYPAGSGVKFWLQPITSRTLLEAHRAQLMAFLPPSSDERDEALSYEDLREKSKTDPNAAAKLEKLEKSLAAQFMKAATDPENIRKAWEHDVACLRASVVGLSEGEGPMEEIRLVEKDEDADASCKPELVPFSAVGPEALGAILDEIKRLSFNGGGPGAVARFR
jgi:hypothetical protein